MAYTKQFLLSRQYVESALIKPPNLPPLRCIVDSPGETLQQTSKLVGKENRSYYAMEQSYSQKFRQQDCSRQNLAARDVAASSYESTVSLGKEVEPMLKGPPTLNDELAKIYSELYIENYILKRNKAVMMKNVSERFHDATIHKFVSSCVQYLVNETSTDRMLGGVILELLMVNSYLTPKQLEDGVGKIMKIVEDLITDIPNLFENVGEILEPLFSSSQISLVFLREVGKSFKKSKYRSMLLTGVMQVLFDKLGEKRTINLWIASGLKMHDFVNGQDQKNFTGDDETPNLYQEGVHLSSSETDKEQTISSTKAIEHKPLYSYFDEEQFQNVFGTSEKNAVENPTIGQRKEVVGSERTTDEEARVFPLPENCNSDLDLSSIQLIPQSNVDAVLKLSDIKLSMDEKTVAPTVQDNLFREALPNEKERKEIIDVFSDGGLDTDGKLLSIKNSEISKEAVASTAQDIFGYKYVDVELASSRKGWDGIERDIPSISRPLDLDWRLLTGEKTYVGKEEYPTSRQSFESSPGNRFVERPVSSCSRSESGELKPPGFDHGSNDLFTGHSLALTAIFDQLQKCEKLFSIQNKELKQHKAKINQLSQENEVFKKLFLSIGKQTKENQENVSVIKDILQKSGPFLKSLLVPEENISRKDIGPSERSLDGSYSQKMVDNSERFRNMESSFSTDKPSFNTSQHIGDYSSSATGLRFNRVGESSSASADSLFNRSTERFSEAAGTSFSKSDEVRTTEGSTSSEDRTRLPLSKGVVENFAAARLNTVRKSINWKVQFNRDMLQQIDAGYVAPFLETPVHCFPDRVGYNMAFEAYPNGYGRGRGSHLSLYWRLVSGENDNKLRWPFTGTVTFVLLPVNTNDRSVTSTTRVCSRMAPFHKPRVPANDSDVMDGWGIPRFVRHDIALSPTYLSKNGLTITVHVDVEESAFSRV